MKYDRLYITEKDTQVDALSVVENAVKRGKVAYNDEKRIAIAPLQGHVLINDDVRKYSEEFNGFRETSLNTFPVKLRLRPNPVTKAKLTEVLELIKETKEIVIATDNDNEGASIALNVIEKANALDKVVFMLPMGSTHPDELRKNIENPGKIPYMTMAQAGRARAWIDFVEGMYLSRALSYYLGNNYQLKLNFGGVKAPLTYIVVERDLAFESHKVSYFWTAKGIAVFDGKEFSVKIQQKVSTDGKETWEDKFDSVQDIEKAIKELENKTLTVGEYVKKTMSIVPPKLFELTGLQAEMSKTYRTKPDASMELAQKNYDFPVSIQGYPRTDVPYLKEAEYVDVPEILSKLQKTGRYSSSVISEILNNKIPKRKSTFNDKEVVAHGAITPTLKGDYNKWLKDLPPLNQNMFDMIATRYIANFMQDYEYMSIVGTTTPINGVRLHFSESIPLKAGWKEIYDSEIVKTIESSKQESPNLKVGNEISLKSISHTRNETKPKEQFTMSELLKAMGKIANLFPEDEVIKKYLGDSGIGTAATRSSIIAEVMDMKKNNGEPWLIEKKGKIISTEKARSYIKAMPEDLVSPIKRALLSKKLKDIEHGTLSYEDLIKDYRGITNDNIELIKKITAENGPITGGQSTVMSLGECPLCHVGQVVEKTKSYVCSEARFKKLEDGTFENSGCQYSIYKGSLAKLGKANISKSDVAKMLSKGSVSVGLVSAKTKKAYDAMMVPDMKYGVKVEFNFK